MINASPIDRVQPGPATGAVVIAADDDGAQRPRDICEAERAEGDQQEQLWVVGGGRTIRGSSRRKKP
jgi:hypothetical protein